MGASEKLVDAMGSHDVFSINFLNHSIPVSDTVVTMWIIMAFLIVLSFIFTRKLKMVPDGRQNFVESIVGFVNDLCKNNIGHHWKSFAPYLGTVFLFLIFSNIISIFDIIPGEGYKLRPPTKNINVTGFLAATSIVIVIFSGIRYKKFSGWIKGFAKPTPIMIPFNIMDYFVRPLSLCLRLFGNILSAFIIMELIYIVMPALIPAPFSLYFDLADGILQAYIFVFLTSLYIAEVIE